MAKPVLFLWSAHWIEKVLACAKEVNVVLMRIPPGYPCVCQPADVCWNKPFKQKMHGFTIWSNS
ncbi:hypothetical protein PHMEG_0002210 [Phytophthora megakarya]|uniref:Uncharacterized protein n=1 Tax=Phytophthora megakarya TaxID=4795 RepID=A0A225WZE0_9STRA|nr:hypothetical protein PHMEG_0002210 [Phytophthora megakarya]